MPTDRRVDLLERIGNLIRSDARDAAHRAGLQPVQLDVLSYLARCNRYSDTPAAVAEYLQLTKGTISQSIQRLEEKGFVERQTDTDDRRVSHLSLTPEARRLLRSYRRGATATAFGSHDDRLDELLEDWLRALQQAHGQKSFGVCETCRFFEKRGASRFRCGLTSEPLSVRDSGQICREHTPLEADTAGELPGE